MGSQPWCLSLQDRAGALWAPAQSAARALGWRASAPTGPDALRELRSALGRYVDQEPPDEEKDREWIEQHGALLGLVLLEALGGTGHFTSDERHLVGLGTWGCFDPFAALEEALYAEDPRGLFLEGVKIAEAEAAGAGPISKVVSAFARVLENERPDLQILAVHALQVSLSAEVQVDLQQVARSTDGLSPSALSSACEKLISMIPGGDGQGERQTWEEAAPRLMPRLVGDAFVNGLDEGARESLFLIPLRPDLHLMLLLEFPKRSRFVRAVEVERWPEAEADIILRAINNLSRRSDKAAARWAQDQAPALLLFQSRDGWDASRLVLPGLFDVASTELRPPFAVAVPHRDELALCEWNDHDAVERLREHAADAYARAPHGISPSVYRLDEEGLMSKIVKPSTHE